MRNKIIAPRSACFLLALCVTAAVWAQEEGEKKAEEPMSAPKLNKVTLSFNGLKTYRNRWQARRFGTPVSGPALEELLYFVPGSDATPYGKITIHDTPDRDYWAGGHAILAGGKTEVSLSTMHRRYYRNGFTPTDQSTDTATRFVASQGFGNSGIFVSYDDSQRKVRPEEPRAHYSPRQQRIAGGFQGQFGKVNAALTASQNRISDGFGTRPTSVNRTFGVQVTGDIGQSVSVMGNLQYTKVEQAGLMDSSYKSMGLAATIDLGLDSSLHFDLSRQDISVPNTQSGYDRQRFQTGARFMTRFNGWAVQIGWRHREAERVRADRSFVDVPSWNLWDFRLSKAFGNGLRWTLRGSWDDLTHAALPGSTASDNRQLLWDDKSLLQSNLSWTGENTSAYFLYTYRYRANSARSVKLGWDNFTLGVNHNFSDKLNGFLEYSYDNFRGGGTVEGSAENLGDYFPNSVNLSTGMTFQLDPKCTVSGSFNTFATNNVWGTQFLASYQRHLANDQSIQLDVAPFAVHDRLLGQTGYRINFISLKYSVRF